jgi:uncharacterized delta-60 repeat protein
MLSSMNQLLRPSIFFAWCRYWIIALPLTVLVPPARAQAPTIVVTPAGPVTLCAGSNQALTATPNLAGASYTWSNGATGPSITVGQPGLYQVTATSTSGTVYSNVVAVNAPPSVKVQVAPAGPLTLPFGNSQTLIATATIPGFNVGGSGVDNSVNKVLVQPDGKIIVGGYFTSYNGNAAAPDNLLRLNADGSLDTSFNNGGAGIGGIVSTMALQPDGKIVVGGFLRTYNGNAAAPDMVLRVNADGSLDTSFNLGGTGFDNGVRALALQADGRILVGGGFTSYNGSAAAPDYLVRLTASGSLDTSFNNGGASTNSNVYDLAVQPDGKALVAGNFTGYNGSLAAPDYFLRLAADGSLDTSFNSGGIGLGGNGTPNNTYVSTLAVQADGRILLGGIFISYNGNAAVPDNLLRLNSDGSLDTNFNSGGAGPNARWKSASWRLFHWLQWQHCCLHPCIAPQLKRDTRCELQHGWCWHGCLRKLSGASTRWEGTDGGLFCQLQWQCCCPR